MKNIIQKLKKHPESVYVIAEIGHNYQLNITL